MLTDRISIATAVVRGVGMTLSVLLFLGTPIPLPAAPTLLSIQEDTTSVSSETKKLLVRGMTEASLGDYTEAITYFEAALEEAPDSPILYLSLADAHAAQGNYTTALFYARQALTQGEERVFYYQRLAELQQQAGSPRAALRTYSKLLNHFPKNVRAYEALAHLQSTLDRPRKALATYEALLNHLPTVPAKVHRERLSLYRQVGDSSGVQKALEYLVDARPGNDRYRRQLARLYAEEEKYEAALDLLEPLVAAYPNDRSLRNRVERLSRKAGREEVSATVQDGGSATSTPKTAPDSLVARAGSLYVEAKSASSPTDTIRLRRAQDLLRQALEHAPKSLDPLRLLAKIHHEGGEHLKEAHILNRVLKKDPGDPDLWAQAASAFQKAGHHEKAVSVAKEGLVLFPGQYSLRKASARAHLHLQNWQQALAHFRRALESTPDSSVEKAEKAFFWAGLGLCRDRLGRQEKAYRAFEHALSLNPNDPMALNQYASSLLQAGEQLDRALKMAQRAVDQAPGNPKYLGTLGWVYFKRKNLQAARRYLRKALNTASPSARLLERYGDVQRALGNETKARQYWRKAFKRAPNRDSLPRKLGRTSEP